MAMAPASPGITHFFVGTPGNDSLDGTPENDRISLLAGNDISHGKGGDDTIDGGLGNDQLWGQGGNDLLLGGAGNDLIWGGDGNDVLNGGAGKDSLYSGSGNDRLVGGPGGDLLHGGDGNDWLFDVPTLNDPSGLQGDALYGDAGNDHLTTAVTNGETTPGNLGAYLNVTLDGGAGDDVLSATAKLGARTNHATQVLNGGDGNDTIVSAVSASGHEAYADHRVNGGSGQDQISISTAASGTVAGGTVLAHGGGGNDTMRVDLTVSGGVLNGGSSTLFGDAGDDRLILHANAFSSYGVNIISTLSGGAGNDYLEASVAIAQDVHTRSASTVFDGGKGNDTIVGSAFHDDVVLRLGDGVDRVNGFQKGTDDFALAPGLDFAHLKLTDVQGANDGTLISDAENHPLAFAAHVHGLDAHDFITAPSDLLLA